MTVLSGRWKNPAFINYSITGTYGGGWKNRGWWVQVERGVSPETRYGIEVAKDGYAAQLGDTHDISARIYPRFQHKHFPWGEAASFLVQYQNDTGNYSPCNGLLEYEVHGITNDGKYTVVAQFGVTHPKLPEFGDLRANLRDYRDDTYKPDSPMRRDPDYILVEHCPDSDFQPSLTEIDAMLATIQVTR